MDDKDEDKIEINDQVDETKNKKGVELGVDRVEEVFKFRKENPYSAAPQNLIDPGVSEIA